MGTGEGIQAHLFAHLFQPGQAEEGAGGLEMAHLFPPHLFPHTPWNRWGGVPHPFHLFSKGE